ncbi:hypothetical protein HU200_045018 [Digitaria exilis]|uniref:Uncharacterized protein n=1 Tax=Digitaria exilis TaxID=1010633 RepID=A0A835BBU4_9POAL|nr:hypothetical protein HU200_045018 [Digitaria exilis]
MTLIGDGAGVTVITRSRSVDDNYSMLEIATIAGMVNVDATISRTSGRVVVSARVHPAFAAASRDAWIPYRAPGAVKKICAPASHHRPRRPAVPPPVLLTRRASAANGALALLLRLGQPSSLGGLLRSGRPRSVVATALTGLHLRPSSRCPNDLAPERKGAASFTAGSRSPVQGAEEGARNREEKNQTSLASFTPIRTTSRSRSPPSLPRSPRMGAPPVATQAGTPIAVRAHRFRCRNLEQQPPLLQREDQHHAAPLVDQAKVACTRRADGAAESKSSRGEGSSGGEGRRTRESESKDRDPDGGVDGSRGWEKHRECQTGRCRGGKRREVPPSSSSINVPIHRHHRRRWVRLQMAFDQPAGGHSSGPARGGIPMPPDVGSPARLTAPAPSTHGPTPRHLPRPPFPLLSASLYIYPLPPLPPTLLFLTQDSNSKNPREREKVPSPASLQFAKPLPNPNPDGRHRLRRCPRPGAGRVHAPTPPAGAGGHSTPSRRLRRSGRRGAVRGSEAGVLAAARTPSFRLWFLERWMCHVMLEEEEDVRFRSFLQTQETSPSPCSPRVGRYDELKRHLVGLVAEAAGEEGDKLHCAIALVRAAYAIVRLAHWCYPNAALPPLPLEQKFEAVVQESLGELTPLLGFDILAPEVGEGEAVLIKGVIMAVNVASAAARTARYIQGVRWESCLSGSCMQLASRHIASSISCLPGPRQPWLRPRRRTCPVEYTRITRLLVPSSISRPCTRSLLNMMRNAMMLSSEFEVFLASGRGFRWWRRIKKTHNRMTVARRRSRANQKETDAYSDKLWLWCSRMWVTEAMPRSAPRNDVMVLYANLCTKVSTESPVDCIRGDLVGPSSVLQLCALLENLLGRRTAIVSPCRGLSRENGKLQRPIGNVVESGGDGETSPFATFNSTPIKVRGLGRLLVFLLAPRETTAGSDKIAADEPVVTCVKGPAHQYYRISPPQPSLVGSGALLHRPRCTHKPSAVMWRDKRATSHATSPSPGQRELEAASEMDGSDGTGPAINLHLGPAHRSSLPSEEILAGDLHNPFPRALSSETRAGESVRFGHGVGAAGPVVHLGGGGAAVPGSGMISAAMGSLLFGVGGVPAPVGNMVQHGGYLASAGYNTMPTDAMLAAADAGGEQQQLRRAAATAASRGRRRSSTGELGLRKEDDSWVMDRFDELLRTLKEMVTLYGERKWAVISQHLPGRIGKQCRERWTNHLRPGVDKVGIKSTPPDLLV